MIDNPNPKKISEARITEIAKILAADPELVRRHRDVTSRIPIEPEVYDLEPTHPARIEANQWLADMRKIVREIEPQISDFDCMEAIRFFAEWSFGRGNLDN